MAKSKKGGTTAVVDAPEIPAADGDSLMPDLGVADDLLDTDALTDISATGDASDELSGSSDDGESGAGADEDGGEDTAVFDLSEYEGGTVLFDGASGIDTLRLVLSETEVTELREELIELRDFIESGDHGPVRDGGLGGSDGVEVFTTSFGLAVTSDISTLEVHVEGVGPVSLDGGTSGAEAEFAALGRAVRFVRRWRVGR